MRSCVWLQEGGRYRAKERPAEHEMLRRQTLRSRAPYGHDAGDRRVAMAVRAAAPQRPSIRFSTTPGPALKAQRRGQPTVSATHG